MAGAASAAATTVAIDARHTVGTCQHNGQHVPDHAQCEQSREGARSVANRLEVEDKDVTEDEDSEPERPGNETEQHGRSALRHHS